MYAKKISDLLKKWQISVRLMQVNADSIIGKDGFGTKTITVKKLMKTGSAQVFVGSDCHGTQERISRIGEAYDYVSKKEGDSYANQLFIRNPLKIIADAQRRKGR